MPPPEVMFVLAIMGVIVVAGAAMLYLKYDNWRRERDEQAPIYVKHSADKYPAITSSKRDEGADRLGGCTAPAPALNPGAKPCAPERTPHTEECDDAPIDALLLSIAEQVYVRRMVYTYGRMLAANKKPSKGAIIKEVTGYSKSGDPNSRYARYSLLYDTFLGEPEPAVKAPHLAAQQKEQWQPNS
jgi:hypothetical protein